MGHAGRSLRELMSLGLSLAILGVACGGGDAVIGEPPTSTTSTVPGVDLTQQCSAPGHGFEIRYPSSWHTATADGGPPCRFFHPEPFTLRPDTEASGIAIVVQVEGTPLDDLVPGPEGSVAVDVVNRRATEVARRKAFRLETRATGAALLPEDARAVTWYVEFPSGTLVATTNDQASSGSLRRNARVLDAMVATAKPLGSRACSAGTARRDGPAPQELPIPVAATREEIVHRATQCDFEGLGGAGFGG